MVKKIYLVGAGPGDVELLTLKAINILKKADVVLYDALVNPDALNFCKENAIKEHVGKRKDRHLKKQSEINQLLVEYGKTHEIVVRLKGGTPFVFGRGYEEVRAIIDAGFEPEIISGVSATTSVPESFMIPSIDRKFNDSYRTITGHDVEIFSDIVTSYHERENLVIMMGIYHLKEIVSILISKGFPLNLPLAILSKGSTKDASKLISSLGEIEDKNDEFFTEIRALTPAMIFVGASVNSKYNS